MLLCVSDEVYSDEQKFDHEIFVTSISWHTGIIIPGHILPDSIWHVDDDFSQYDYLEIGWGDKDFFQNPAFNVWHATKAVFWPTKTALHINPVSEDYLKWYYSGSRLVKLSIASDKVDDLVKYLMDHIRLDDSGKVIYLDKGPYTSSQFIAGSHTYYFPKNSNVWAASALKSAGISYCPLLYQTTAMVVNRAAKFGHKVDTGQ